tara:strand:+ start:8945 stop:10204 length:1260 start_codon:yes stop_codon:yes gene_type:complete
MSSIKLKHSGGNGVSIAAPASNPTADRILTLPSTDADGVITTKDSNDNLQAITGINGGKLGNRNLINNGAFAIAQRSTTATGGGFLSVDRFKCQTSGLDEDITQAQADVAAGTTPYSLGFRKCYKITNGNQTSGAGGGDLVKIQTSVEAQNIASSGWNYLSSTSYITLQFWVKSSVSQNFYFNLVDINASPNQNYVMETGVLTANTWTKITKKIEGKNTLVFNAGGAGEGLRLEINAFRGGDTTGTQTLNQWHELDTANRMPTNTTTWFTTNDATFEITGVQLEVGDTPTNFEFKSYQEDYYECLRYCYVIPVTNGDFIGSSYAFVNSTTQIIGQFTFPRAMRTFPTKAQTSSLVRLRAGNSSANFNLTDIIAHLGDTTNPNPFTYGFIVTTSSISTSQSGILQGQNTSAGRITFSAEF